MQNYTDIDAFHADRGGAKSPECDFGGFHHAASETPLPPYQRERWRVSVVALTGDVYAEAARSGAIRLIGRLGGGPYGHVDQQGRVVIESRDYKARAYVDADLVFAHWAQAVGRAVEWFGERLARFNAARANDTQNGDTEDSREAEHADRKA